MGIINTSHSILKSHLLINCSSFSYLPVKRKDCDQRIILSRRCGGHTNPNTVHRFHFHISHQGSFKKYTAIFVCSTCSDWIYEPRGVWAWMSSLFIFFSLHLFSSSFNFTNISKQFSLTNGMCLFIITSLVCSHLSCRCVLEKSCLVTQLSYLYTLQIHHQLQPGYVMASKHTGCGKKKGVREHAWWVCMSHQMWSGQSWSMMVNKLHTEVTEVRSGSFDGSGGLWHASVAKTWARCLSGLIIIPPPPSRRRGRTYLFSIDEHEQMFLSDSVLTSQDMERCQRTFSACILCFDVVWRSCGCLILLRRPKCCVWCHRAQQRGGGGGGWGTVEGSDMDKQGRLC